MTGVRAGAEAQGLPHGGTALRKGVPGDENAIVEAVGNLLSELGGPGPEFSLEGAKQAALRMIQDPEEGFIFVIEEQATGQIVVDRCHLRRTGCESSWSVRCASGAMDFSRLPKL